MRRTSRMPVTVDHGAENQIVGQRADLSRDISEQEFAKLVANLPAGQKVEINRNVTITKTELPSEMELATTRAIDHGVKFFAVVIFSIVIAIIATW